MTAYDPQNIFGQMLRGEIPSVKVYEDETVLVVMDIFPHSRGQHLGLFVEQRTIKLSERLGGLG